jgi:hypothetical protein
MMKKLKKFALLLNILKSFAKIESWSPSPNSTFPGLNIATRDQKVKAPV